MNEPLPEPCCPEAETGLLESCIQSPDFTFGELVAHVEPETLIYHPLKRVVLNAMRAMFTAGLPLSASSVSIKLHETGMLDKVGGADFISEIDSATPPTEALIKYHIDRLISYRGRRDALVVLRKAVEEAQAVNEQTEQTWLQNAAMGMLDAASKMHGQKKRRSWKELLRNAFDRAEERIKNQGALPGISTGFDRLDMLTGGFQGGQMWCIGGGSSDGKSAFAQQCGFFAAKHHHPTAIFTLEMPDDELADRSLSSAAKIPSDELKRGIGNREGFKNFTEAIRLAERWPIHILDVSGIRLSELRAEMRLLVASYGVKLIIIDYGQLVQADRREHSREREVALMSMAMKADAKSLNVCVIVLSQLNDDGKLRESRAIGFDSDVVGTLSVPEDDVGNKDDTRRILFVGKNRNGERNTPIYFHFHGPTFTFSETDPPERPKEAQRSNGKKYNSHRGQPSDHAYP